MSDELDAVEANYFGAWRILVGAADGGEIDDSATALFATIPAPVAYFNRVFVKPPARVADHVDDAVAFYAERKKPFTIGFREGDVGADVACERHGLVAGGASPVMVADVAAIGPVGDLDVRVVDAASLASYVETMAAGYEIPAAFLATVVTAAGLEHPDFALVLGYVDGEPVATAALVVTDDMAGVYNVGTPPALRRRGYGEAITAAAVAEGRRRGCTRTTLQASTMGFPIYERMGYRTATMWRSFIGENVAH